jgi:23S rRNA pseudouridine2604 synthase
VVLASDASPVAAEPVTLLLHKPPGVDAGDGAMALLVPRHRATEERAGPRTMPAHFRRQVGPTPLETTASGLVVFTQDPRILRRLTEDASLIEHETLVDVAGDVDDDALARLLAADPSDTRRAQPIRASIGSRTDETTRLRFAIKGHQPGRIERVCAAAGLRMHAMRRTRIGRCRSPGCRRGSGDIWGPPSASSSAAHPARRRA